MRAALLGLVPAALPAAAVYKWVDENGVTHYSELPPADGKATKVETRTGGPSGATDDWKQRELESRKQRLEGEKADDYATRKSTQDAAVRSNRCAESREQVETLERARPIYRIDEHGERVYLEDKDRQRQIEQWRSQAEKYCAP